MMPEHHPNPQYLGAFAAGTLDLGQHVAIATHLVGCQHCRSFVHSMEETGGALLENERPSAMSPSALTGAEARLSSADAFPHEKRLFERPVRNVDVPRLPEFVTHYRFGSWTWVAPSVHVRRIELPHPSGTRVFLLRAGPGTHMLQHGHRGLEMTCVLAGAFTQSGSYYGPGDFDIGDEEIEHQPLVESGEECVCLVAMQGSLELKGFFGRLMQPFVRL
jgi:putative transcriptional regulator